MMFDCIPYFLRMISVLLILVLKAFAFIPCHFVMIIMLALKIIAIPRLKLVLIIVPALMINVILQVAILLQAAS